MKHEYDKSILTNEGRKLVVDKLVNIYYLSDFNPRAVDNLEKEKLYALAGKYPSIHDEARRIYSKGLLRRR